jgi:hypothetical protein
MKEGAQKTYLIEKFLPYFDEIRVATPLEERVNNFLKEYNGILKAVSQETAPEEVENILITDNVSKENERTLENLWFFTQNYAMEMKDFKNDLQNMDITKYKDKVVYLQVKKNYSFDEDVSESSRLYVYFRLSTGVDGELRASAKNCRQLHKIMRDCLAKNLIKPINSA